MIIMEKNTVVTEDNKVKEPKTPKQKVFFALKIVGNVLFYALLLLLFLWSIMNINGGARDQGFPNIFGRGFLNVLTDSMSHEDLVNDLYEEYPEYKNYEIQGINVGDLVYSKVLNDEDRQNLKVGDVCTFYDSKIKALNTHRIIVVEKDSSGKISKIIFQGDKSVASYGKYDTLDNSQKAELTGKNEVQIFGSGLSDIKGITTGVSAGAGKVLKNLQDNWLWYFVFPVIILLLVEVFLVIRNIMILRGEKNKVALEENKDAILADEKERMRQELLAELRAQGLAPAETPAEPAKVEEPVQEEVAPAVVTEEAQEEKLDAEVEEKAEESIQEEATPEVDEETPTEEVVEEIKEEQPTEAEPEKEAEVEEKVEEPVQEETTEEAPAEEVAQEESVQEEVNEPEVEETPVENKEEVQEEPKEEATPEVEAEPEVKEETPKKAPAKKKTTSTTGAKKTTTKKAATDKPKATTKTAAKKTTTKKETK